MTDLDIYRLLNKINAEGFTVALATIVSAHGSTPRDVGAKMIVTVDGKIFGSVGGGCGESTVVSAALKCLLTERAPKLVEVDLTDELGTRGADVCGGRMEVFVDLYEPGDQRD